MAPSLSNRFWFKIRPRFHATCWRDAKSASPLRGVGITDAFFAAKYMTSGQEVEMCKQFALFLTYCTFQVTEAGGIFTANLGFLQYIRVEKYAVID